MLVITRKKNERIVIEVNGITIQLRLNETKNKYAKLAFTAPKSVRILRHEVKQREIKEAKAKAAAAPEVTPATMDVETSESGVSANGS